MPERFVVIMAGGRGERFWPQSREATPKHLLPIVGDQPMLAQTVARVTGIVPAANIFVITTKAQLGGCRDVCPELQDNIVAEPEGRDTAAATGLAMLLVKQRNPTAAFAMLPADHVIHDTAEYAKLLNVAFEAAESPDDVLVTLGIKPTAPETGFGYIQQAGPWRKVGGRDVMAVKRFVEKPDLATAKGYLASGEYFWNTGMFVWRVPVVEAAFKAHAPGLYAGLKQLEAALTQAVVRDTALLQLYPTLQKISVDYALMEKSTNVVVVPATFDWDDVGAWPAIAKHFTPDAAGNVLRGLAMVEGGANNIVISTDGHLTGVVGASDLVVVHTAEATLVVPKDKAQEIKALLERLKQDPAKKKYL